MENDSSISKSVQLFFKKYLCHSQKMQSRFWKGWVTFEKMRGDFKDCLNSKRNAKSLKNYLLTQDKKQSCF